MRYYNKRGGCPGTLNIRLLDALTGEGIPGARMGLADLSGAEICGRTGISGDCRFNVHPCSRLLLSEINAPGFCPSIEHNVISTDCCGQTYVNGTPACGLTIYANSVNASFTAIKRDISTGLPLAGAVYTLYKNGTQIATATSDANGNITFSGLSAGKYELVETTAPAGYQANVSRVPVDVSCCGVVTICCFPANGYVLYNVPADDFIFLKINIETGLPLANAVFQLMQGPTLINGAISGADGLVKFGKLASGNYQLTETVPPYGYRSNSHVYQVVVNNTGLITVDNIPLAQFKIGNF